MHFIANTIYLFLMYLIICKKYMLIFQVKNRYSSLMSKNYVTLYYNFMKIESNGRMIEQSVLVSVSLWTLVCFSCCPES